MDTRLQIRKILVPIDYSNSARNAMLFACDLARRYEAALTLLHVYQIPNYVLPEGIVMVGPETVASLLDRAGKALEDAKQEVEQLGIGNVATRIEQGVPFAEIVRVAREGSFDLLVLGTHGRTGIKHALLGSVAEKVVRKSPCAVLTVRSPEHRFEHP